MANLSLSLDKLIAHRGLQSDYPENTVLSLNKAIEYGAKYIELDIQFSGDCLPIIYHDADLNRVSAKQGNILDYSRQDLLKLSAYEPQRLGNRFKTESIAALEALVPLLLQNPLVTAFVELKEESIGHCGRETMLNSVQSILDSVKHQVVLISYDYLLMRQARENCWPSVGVVLKQWQDLKSDMVKNITSDYIFVDCDIIPDTPEQMSLNGACFVAFEVGDKELGRQLLTKGISLLETYNLKQLSE